MFCCSINNKSKLTGEELLGDSAVDIKFIDALIDDLEKYPENWLRAKDVYCLSFSNPNQILKATHFKADSGYKSNDGKYHSNNLLGIYYEYFSFVECKEEVFFVTRDRGTINTFGNEFQLDKIRRDRVLRLMKKVHELREIQDSTDRNKKSNELFNMVFGSN